MSDASDAILAQLRAFGLSYPGAHSKAPWPEHDDLAVNDKTFAYLPVAGQAFTLSVKLPYTGEVALELPYAKPTGYGLGKSGWVSFAPSEDEMPSLDQLRAPVPAPELAAAPDDAAGASIRH